MVSLTYKSICAFPSSHQRSVSTGTGKTCCSATEDWEQMDGPGTATSDSDSGLPGAVSRASGGGVCGGQSAPLH